MKFKCDRDVFSEALQTVQRAVSSRPGIPALTGVLMNASGKELVLATTDPQKIPVTVLSRCLQFNLKPLSATLIAARVTHILGAEGIAYDESAVALIARAAQGSVRDALSLLDQAIAFGAGEVRESVVRAMLGAVDRDHVYRIIDALIARDGAALLAESAALGQRGLAFTTALDDLASLFHRTAVAQIVPSAAAIHARERSARLSDLHAGPRRSRACAGRRNGLLDDAAPSACIRAGERSRIAQVSPI